MQCTAFLHYTPSTTPPTPPGSGKLSPGTSRWPSRLRPSTLSSLRRSDWRMSYSANSSTGLSPLLSSTLYLRGHTLEHRSNVRAIACIVVPVVFMCTTSLVIFQFTVWGSVTSFNINKMLRSVRLSSQCRQITISNSHTLCKQCDDVS